MCATIACLALLACAMRPAAAGNSTLAVGPRKVSLSDIVAAMPADLDHMDVARASRIWRKVRACCAGVKQLEQCVFRGHGTEPACSLAHQSPKPDADGLISWNNMIATSDDEDYLRRVIALASSERQARVARHIPTLAAITRRKFLAVKSLVRAGIRVAPTSAALLLVE